MTRGSVSAGSVTLRRPVRASGLVGGLLLGILGTPPLLAHRLDATARIAEGAVFVEAFFAEDDAPAPGAEVTVVEDTSGDVVARGRTDGEGRFRFIPKRQRDLLVVVDDGVGHRAEIEIEAERLDELRGSVARGSGAASSVAGGAGSARGSSTQEQVIGRSTPGGLASYGPPWLRVVIGLGAVALLALLVRAALRSRSRGSNGAA